MKTKILFSLIIFSIITSGCGSFLKERSQNSAYVETVGDLNELIVGGGYLRGNFMYDESSAEMPSNWNSVKITDGSFMFIHLLDDDSDQFLHSNNQSNDVCPAAFSKALHTWQSIPFIDIKGVEFPDNQWASVYSRIALVNSILHQLSEMSVPEKDFDLARKVKGEALFIRALNYFWLANVYARPYCKATADKDLCIPLKTDAGVVGGYFARTPMNKVYNQIVADLEGAAASLEGLTQKTKYRADEMAAYALLSRVHLYMEEYQKAIDCADKVILSQQYMVRDLNYHDNSGNFTALNSPETIFSQGASLMFFLQTPASMNNLYANSYRSSQDLLSSFNDDDLRLSAFFLNAHYTHTEKNRCIKFRNKADGFVSDIFLIRYPEVILNKAEAQALLRREIEAKATLKELMGKRYNLAPEISAAGDDFVSYVRDERRRELCFEGHRWFDLRRYAVNRVVPFQKEIVHYYYESVNNITRPVGYYTLKRYSEDASCYMLPIPKAEIEYNKGMLTNEIRPERDITLL